MSFPLIPDYNQALLLCAKLREALSNVMARSLSCYFYVRNAKFWVDEEVTGVGEGKCFNPSRNAEAG